MDAVGSRSSSVNISSGVSSNPSAGGLLVPVTNANTSSPETPVDSGLSVKSKQESALNVAVLQHVILSHDITYPHIPAGSHRIT